MIWIYISSLISDGDSMNRKDWKHEPFIKKEKELRKLGFTNILSPVTWGDEVKDPYPKLIRDDLTVIRIFRPVLYMFG